MHESSLIREAQLLLPELTRLCRRSLLCFAMAAAVVPATWAADPERRIRVDDAARSLSFDDMISDFEVVTYVVTLRTRERLRVRLATNNASNCFDLYAPGSSKPAFVGGNSGNEHELTADTSGEYLIKVYLLRLAARDGQTANYSLELQRTVTAP
jgi:hypothetical protein